MKVTIIGSGAVGASIGYALTFVKEVSDIVFIDVNNDLAVGEALDISPGISDSSTIVRGGSYIDCETSDIIIISAGRNRKPGQTRDDLLEVNRKIMDGIAEKLVPVYKNSFIIVVSNPVDYLTGYLARKGFMSKYKICGTGCMLDASRWIFSLSKYLRVKNKDLNLFVIGKHGDGQQILWDMVNVGGMRLEEFCAMKDIAWNVTVKNDLSMIVTNMGGDIIAKKGKTQYGIASVVVYMVKLLADTDKKVVSVSNVLENSDITKTCSSLVLMGNMCITDISEKVDFVNL